VLAVAGNSPTFLGHRLWEETRVALFKQAVDDRDAAGRSSRRVSRVAFGTGWTTAGALELLAESARLHEPVLPVLGPERPLALVEAGRLPALDELRLHQGTVWRWNRAIYDPAAGGHLRIELRALPAGPTVVDMLANAAFALGLTLALAPEAGRWTRRLAFQQAHHNFYRAAQLGLGPSWPGRWDPTARRARSRRASWPCGCCPPPPKGWRPLGWRPRRPAGCWRSSRRGWRPARPAPPGSARPWPPWSHGWAVSGR
jgi:hypothetical protein